MKKREVRRGLDSGENYGGNTTMFFLSNPGKELQITPSGIIRVIDLRVLGYCSKDH
jgi:hypothetical protein